MESDPFREGSEGAFARTCPRLYELCALTPDPGSYTAYFHRQFTPSLASPRRMRAWSARERDLQALDGPSWEALKEKLRPHLNGLDRDGRGWQQLIEALNEARAYRYLAEDVGARDMRFVPETADQTPDIEAMAANALILCETKTISESDAEIYRRVQGAAGYISNRLPDEFLAKVLATIAGAAEQLRGYRSVEHARRMVFLIVNFDDALGEHAEDFYAQIDARLASEKHDCELVFLNRHTCFTANISMKNAVIINE